MPTEAASSVKASQLIAEGRYSAALEHLKQHVRRGQGVADIYLTIAALIRECGQAATAVQVLRDAIALWPREPALRRALLLTSEYLPDDPRITRLPLAKNWSDWIKQGRASRPRPPLRWATGRPLRVGYVSSDICQHTVGLFFEPVLTHHSDRIQPFVYSAGDIRDGTSRSIAARSIFRDVSDLDDAALAVSIEQDQIDILVDLSGHTAGSRLSAFVLRPAAVQVSWLGYCATSGLTEIDAVLLDDAHAPHGTEDQFVETIVRLPYGRLCYQPVPFAPSVSTLPCTERGYITFGSFNNSSKYHPQLLRLWAQILKETPQSRLILKWRTFQDPEFCRVIRSFFEQLGIEGNRVDLRGPSFHENMLKEYAELDIALDPFPFSGGMTSCEALWMGVPIVTWPQHRPVSRQTLSFLDAIGLSQLAANSAEEYVRIAVDLSRDVSRLCDLRFTLRERMRGSSLMDIKGFTLAFERALFELYDTIRAVKV